MKLHFYLFCFSLLLLLFCAGCNNVLGPSIDESASNKSRGSYSWWENREDEEDMNDAYDTQFGDQPSFDNDENPGGEESTGINF